MRFTLVDCTILYQMRSKRNRQKHLIHLNQHRNKSDQQKTLQRKRILDCISSSPINLSKLKQLAFAEKGYVDSYLRCQVWPLLLNVHLPYPLSYKKLMRSNSEDNQIDKDVQRSMWHYDCLQDIKKPERMIKRDGLFGVINALINKHKELSYYQGFHDVCTIFILVFDVEHSFPMIERVSTSFFREAMRPNFSYMMEIMKLLFPLIKTQDSQVHQFLQESSVEPFFAFPWIITWFAHHFDVFAIVTRLYDVLLASHPLFSLYISAAIVLYRKEQLLLCECDFGMVHQFLQKIPQDIPIETIIANANRMIKEVPPTKLKALAKLNISKGCTLFPHEQEVSYRNTRPWLFQSLFIIVIAILGVFALPHLFPSLSIEYLTRFNQALVN